MSTNPRDQVKTTPKTKVENPGIADESRGLLAYDAPGGNAVQAEQSFLNRRVTLPVRSRGIYRFVREGQLHDAQALRMTGRSIGALIVAAAAVTACQKAAPPPTPPPAVVVVAPVVQTDVPNYSEWVGTTAGDINAEIRPQVAGYLLNRMYQEGSFVRKGQLLFQIDPRQFQAQVEQAHANVGQGEAQLNKAKKDVARYGPLAAQHAVSQQELDNAIAAEQVAQANLEALKAGLDQTHLSLEWTKVLSPIDGIAGASLAQVGNLVNPQSVLATVSRVDPIRVQFNLSEQEYLHYREHPTGASAETINELNLVLSDGSVYPRTGRLIFTDRQVDTKTGTISAVGLFPNPGNLLRPGQYAKVRAETRVDRGAILVPQRAVNEIQGAYQIAVVGDDNKAEVRTVQVGRQVGDQWIVEKGLKPHERVVVDGFSRAKAGVVVKPQLASSSHADGPSGASTGAGH
jgi:membrane fusion protein (multidrug efflux system)